uniref:Uncharacterized protein n=1 Tax=Onchocerca volvulus TaxID=6282 RepID=A0A8R1XQC5_ONCVO
MLASKPATRPFARSEYGELYVLLIWKYDKLRNSNKSSGKRRIGNLFGSDCHLIELAPVAA